MRYPGLAMRHVSVGRVHGLRDGFDFRLILTADGEFRSACRTTKTLVIFACRHTALNSLPALLLASLMYCTFADVTSMDVASKVASIARPPPTIPEPPAAAPTSGNGAKKVAASTSDQKVSSLPIVKCLLRFGVATWCSS